jgi:hypothetical protein
MIICINNYLDSATITANGGSDFFPVENLYSPTLYGNNGVTQYTGNIVIDLGSAKNVKAIGLMRSSASVTVEANTSDSWASPAYSIAMDKDVKKIDQTYRYWRIVTAESGSQFIGQFYLGLPIIPEYVSHGSLPQVETSDVENFTATGAYFATKGVDRLVQSFSVTCATQTEYETWYNYWRSDERKKPVIFCQFEETIDNVFPVYFGRLAFNTEGRDRFNYRFNFDLIEVS